MKVNNIEFSNLVRGLINCPLGSIVCLSNSRLLLRVGIAQCNGHVQCTILNGGGTVYLKFNTKVHLKS